MVTHSLPLPGPWLFRFADEPDDAWRPVAVPGCWEEAGAPLDRPGPALYRSRFQIPPAWADKRLWLRFGAVSYSCAVQVNGRDVGEHTGLWDSFRFEISDAARAGDEAELLVRVEKPASLTAGPASPSVPGRFPLKETLSGFLPYVWGHIFGGIWQDVALEATGAVAIEDAYVRGTPDGAVLAEVALSELATFWVEVLDAAGVTIASASGEGASAQVTLQIPAPQPWSPQAPALYTARITVENGDERELRFGLRQLEARGDTLALNGRPLYPRLALSWGWYPQRLCPNPGPERVRADFAKLRALGYNGVKLCLWFPPQYFFDIADELGMLLWVELPMWLPEPTPFFRRQTPLEYERLTRLARQHPAVILYSLGCELNRAVGPDLLGPLFEGVKALTGDALVRDNSGSGEAYGGLLNEFAEYRDYHFYSELQFFQPLLDSFAPRWRPVQPWVFGEFCDLDTFRDLRKLVGSEAGTSAEQEQGDKETRDARRETRRQGGEESEGNAESTADLPLSSSPRLPLSAEAPQPWWVSQDPKVNPQGARWQFDVPFQEERLRALGLWERGDELRQISERQALLHRKWTLELVRCYREIGGYVITGEADTPISTAGMWDDTGRLKFDPPAFRAFNHDLALLIGWDKRRAWVAGGDRSAYYDTTSYPAGALIRPHLIASHYGAAAGPARVRWQVGFAGETPLAQGEHTTSGPLAPGDLREVLVAEFLAPSVSAPRELLLRAELEIGGERAANEWPLWVFPANPWAKLRGVALLDPGERLADLRALAPGCADNLRGARAAIATAWTEELDAFVRAGGGAVLLADEGPGPVATREMPFWREAVRVVEPHPAWGDFPHGGWAGAQFFGCATDRALELPAEARPILWRLDARTMAAHAYALEQPWGEGRLVISTLRFAGGHGTQPAGLARNTAAGYLLRCFAEHIQRIGR
jgi:hypothetical protein